MVHKYHWLLQQRQGMTYNETYLLGWSVPLLVVEQSKSYVTVKTVAGRHHL